MNSFYISLLLGVASAASMYDNMRSLVTGQSTDYVVDNMEMLRRNNVMKLKRQSTKSSAKITSKKFVTQHKKSNVMIWLGRNVKLFRPQQVKGNVLTFQSNFVP